jgi:hypothetical protein
MRDLLLRLIVVVNGGHVAVSKSNFNHHGRACHTTTSARIHRRDDPAGPARCRPGAAITLAELS